MHSIAMDLKIIEHWSVPILLAGDQIPDWSLADGAHRVWDAKWPPRMQRMWQPTVCVCKQQAVYSCIQYFNGAFDKFQPKWFHTHENEYDLPYIRLAFEDAIQDSTNLPKELCLYILRLSEDMECVD